MPALVFRRRRYLASKLRRQPKKFLWTRPPSQTAVARVSLAPAGTPATRTQHALSIRARTTAGAGTIRAALYDEGTGANLSGDLESSALTTSLATYSLPIDDAAAATITDYQHLEVRFWGYAAAGGAIAFEVAEISLGLPSAISALPRYPYPVVMRRRKALRA